MLMPLRRTRSSSPTVSRPSNGGAKTPTSPGSRPTLLRAASKSMFGGAGLGGSSHNNQAGGGTTATAGRMMRSGLRRMDSFGLRRKSSSAAKDLNYLNVLATEGMISTQNILDHLEEVKTTEQIIKLELEDVVLRREDEDEITDALQELALETYERRWISIQFCDCIYAFGTGNKDMDGATKQLCEYDHKRKELYENMVEPNRKNSKTFRLSTLNLQALKDFGTSIRSSVVARRSSIVGGGGAATRGSDGTSSSAGSSSATKSHGSSGMLDVMADLPAPPKTKKQREGHRLPLQFKVKLEIHSGTTLDEILAMMKLFVSSSLESIDFGGALFGYQDRNIPIKLVECFEKQQQQTTTNPQQPQEGGNGGEYVLKEMISFNVQYACPDDDEDDIDTLEVVTHCVKKLTQLKTMSPEKLIRGRSKDGNAEGGLKQRKKSLSRDPSIRRVDSAGSRGSRSLSREASLRRVDSNGSKGSRDGGLRRKKSTRSLSNSSRHSNREGGDGGERRRRSKNDPSSPSAAMPQIPRKKLSRCHSAPSMKKEGSKSRLSTSPQNVLDMEDVDTWGGGLGGSSKGEQNEDDDDDTNNKSFSEVTRLKKLSDRSTSAAGNNSKRKATRTQSAPTSSRKEILKEKEQEGEERPPPFASKSAKTKRKSESPSRVKDKSAPPSKSKDNTKSTKSAAADEVSDSVAKKWKEMDNSSSNSATARTTTTTTTNSKAADKKGKVSSSSSAPPLSKKMPQRTRSVPNLQKGKERQKSSKSPDSTARVSFGSDQFMETTTTEHSAYTDADSMAAMDDEEDWDDDDSDEEEDDEGCRRRKKSDASLSSTAHSQSQRHKKKKHRRRSRSLPNIGGGRRQQEREAPPDFRWDKLQDLSLEPKVVGAAAS